MLYRGNELRIVAEAITGPDGTDVHVREAKASSARVADRILQFVLRTHEPVLLDDAQAPNPLSADEQLQLRRSRSVLCLPLLKQSEPMGVLYLENNLAPHVFTPERTAVLKFLASQGAISLQNASLTEKEALLKELHHRVKNNLTSRTSMASRSRRSRHTRGFRSIA